MKKKIRIALLVIALIGLFVGGTSVAYFTDDVNMNTSKFEIGKVQVEFIGEPTVDTLNEYITQRQMKWSIKNTGTNDIYLRVKILDGHCPNVDGDIVMEVVGRDWEKNNDGYHYYLNQVPPEKHVSFRLEVRFEVFDTVDNLPIDIEVEGIQVSNNAADKLWPKNPFKSK